MPKPQLSAAEAQKRIRELAADSGNIVWTDHVLHQMSDRGIDDAAVRRILQTGYVDDPPIESTQDPNDWVAKITRRMATGRDAGVVTAITDGGRLILITAEWEDESQTRLGG